RPSTTGRISPTCSCGATPTGTPPAASSRRAACPGSRRKRRLLRGCDRPDPGRSRCPGETLTNTTVSRARAASDPRSRTATTRPGDTVVLKGQRRAGAALAGRLTGLRHGLGHAEELDAQRDGHTVRGGAPEPRILAAVEGGEIGPHPHGLV